MSEKTPEVVLLAEQGVLGNVFEVPDDLALVSEIVSPSDFSEPKNELIFNAMLQVSEAGRVPNQVNVLSYLTNNNDAARVGGINYLVRLTDPDTSFAYEADILGCAFIVQDASRKRKIRRLAEQILQDASPDSGMDAYEAQSSAEALIAANSNSFASQSETVSAASLLDDVFAEITSEDVNVGIPTGFPDLDDLTTGWRQDQMIVVGARPAVGKDLVLSTVIPTPSGTTTMGEIKVNDYVLDENGKPTRVMAVSEVFTDHPIYRITFSDGSTVDAGEEHLWYTETYDVRKSRNAQRNFVGQRRNALTEEQCKTLRQAIQDTTAAEYISEFDASRLMGYTKVNPVVTRITKNLPIMGYATMMSNVRTKAVKAYCGSELVKAAVAKPLPALTTEKLGNLQVAIKETPDAWWTARDFAQIIGETEKKRVEYYQFSLRKYGVSARMQSGDLTFRKSSEAIALYDRAQLLKALLAYGDTFLWDQRSKAPVGAVRTTKEILDTLTVSSDERWNHSIPVAKALDLPAQDLLIDPYVLGAWLGDESSDAGKICGIDHFIKDQVVAAGYKVTTAYQQGDNPDFRVWTFEGLRSDLKTLGVLKTSGIKGELSKFIPQQYLRASIEQRRALLAGLVDTDGSANNHSWGVEFYNTNKRLAYEVRELACSLGYRATIVEGRSVLDGVDYGPKWTVRFSTDDDVFRLPRKIAAHREGVRKGEYNESRNSERYIVAVERIETVPSKCIAVDSPNNLFLCGETMIPTHNSTIALDFVRAAALMADAPTAFFSLEMGKSEIMQKILSATAKVELKRMRERKLTDEDKEAIKAAIPKINSAPLYINDSPKLTMGSLRSQCMKLKAQNNLQLVVVDYLQLMSSSGRVESRQQEVSEFSRGIKLLAKELHIPIIILSQLNRGTENRADKRPMASDLRESGSIEQDADLILLLDRPETRDASDRPGQADLILAKQRSGPTGVIPLVPILHFSKFASGSGLARLNPVEPPVSDGEAPPDDEVISDDPFGDGADTAYYAPPVEDADGDAPMPAW